LGAPLFALFYTEKFTSEEPKDYVACGAAEDVTFRFGFDLHRVLSLTGFHYTD
jgi:hypothetical protein